MFSEETTRGDIEVVVGDYVIRVDHPAFDADHRRRYAADKRPDLRWNDRVGLDGESLKVLKALGLGGIEELAAATTARADAIDRKRVADDACHHLAVSADMCGVPAAHERFVAAREALRPLGLEYRWLR